jgi:hypothetical protein
MLGDVHILERQTSELQQQQNGSGARPGFGSDEDGLREGRALKLITDAFPSTDLKI